MMPIRWMAIAVLTLCAACAGTFKVDYTPLATEQTREWRVVELNVIVPDELSVSEDNSLMPNADIVWHGEEFGDRRAQLARIVEEGVRKGTAGLRGDRPVVFDAQVRAFHAVTPLAAQTSPAAVHHISLVYRIRDARSGEVLVPPTLISADLEAHVGAQAISAAYEGRSQRVRIVEHIGRVTAAWLGLTPDMRRDFVSIGR